MHCCVRIVAVCATVFLMRLFLLVFICLVAIVVCDECTFRCPLGKKMITNEKHTPSSNGCGSMGFALDSKHHLDCCNEHDICYDTCFKTKDECDTAFRKCMQDKCVTLHKKEKKRGVHKNKRVANAQRKDRASNADDNGAVAECESQAQMFFFGTRSLGCAAYQQSQKNACKCVKDEL